jgi:Fasciclin domain
MNMCVLALTDLHVPCRLHTLYVFTSGLVNTTLAGGESPLTLFMPTDAAFARAAQQGLLPARPFVLTAEQVRLTSLYH